MNILVTVGTTKFKSLIEAVDKSTFLNNHEVLVQCADGSHSQKYESTVFIENIEEAYEKADLVITHAGAGSVFKLLEAGYHILVVPNMEREDDHQMELARYVKENSYGLVCERLDELDKTLRQAATFSAVPYEKQDFHAAEEINEWISELYN